MFSRFSPLPSWSKSPFVVWIDTLSFRPRFSHTPNTKAVIYALYEYLIQSAIRLVAKNMKLKNTSIIFFPILNPWQKNNYTSIIQNLPRKVKKNYCAKCQIKEQKYFKQCLIFVRREM